MTQNSLNAALHGAGEFPWEALLLQGTLAYLGPVGGNFSLRATYRFTYAFADVPFTMATYANQFLLGVEWEM